MKGDGVMQFTKVDPNLAKKKRVNCTKIDQFIDDFIQANIYVAEVHWESDYKTVESARGSLNSNIVKNRMSHIKLAVRGEKLYIFNELLSDKNE